MRGAGYALPHFSFKPFKLTEFKEFQIKIFLLISLNSHKSLIKDVFWFCLKPAQN